MSVSGAKVVLVVTSPRKLWWLTLFGAARPGATPPSLPVTAPLQQFIGERGSRGAWVTVCEALVAVRVDTERTAFV